MSLLRSCTGLQTFRAWTRTRILVLGSDFADQLLIMDNYYQSKTPNILAEGSRLRLCGNT
jgi:hypothetical protein